jgi:hypothetical protein
MFGENCSEELHYLHFSPFIVRLIEETRQAHIEEVRNACRILVR